MCDIESLVYDFAKSVLIDGSTLRYKGSLIVAALITICIDMYTRLTMPTLTDKDNMQQPLAPCIFDQIKICFDEWDRILERLFGQGLNG